jgi:hypothetical protein
MRAQGDLTMAQIASVLKVGRSTRYQHLDLNQPQDDAEELAA